MAERRALLMINRHCRQGGGDPSAILHRLSQRGIDVQRVDPRDPEHAATHIRRYAGEFDLVILGGGDGTLRSAAAAVRDSGVPLAILPLGTANDLARSLGIPADPLAAVDVVADGVVHRIDLGWVNGHYFFNAASIGMGVGVTKRLSYQRKQRWGVLGYARSVLEAWRDVRPFTAEVICDGERQYLRSIQITVGNGRFYGGGMSLRDDSAVDDQRLDLYSIRPQSLWRIAALLPAIRAGRYGNCDDVVSLRGRRIEVRTRRPRSITADGELVSRTPAVFEVVPAALPVYVPRRVQTRAEGLKHVAQ